MERYSRQILFDKIGQSGQKLLSKSRVTIVGLGALGSVLANHMVRGGVGYVRIIDRDFVEMSNLQRQMLYDETDAVNHLPKAIAAFQKLSKINSAVKIEPVIADINTFNAEEYLSDSDLILDGTDNFTIRFIINDVAVKHNIPWIYGGAVGSNGMFSVIIPQKTPCYRCLFNAPPESGHGETCDTLGVIGPIIHIIASYQATEAFKILVGDYANTNPYLEQFDIWLNDHKQISILQTKNSDCPACKHHQFDFLNSSAEEQEQITYLCGRNTVQITSKRNSHIELDQLADKLKMLGKIEKNKFLLRFTVDPYCLVFFQDGRVLIQGTDDISIARTLYAKYIGM